MNKKELETRIKTIADGLAALIELVGDLAQMNPEPVAVTAEEKPLKKKATKKTTKKKTTKKKSSPAEGTLEEVVKVDTTISFTAGVTPKGAKEQRIFKEHWAALTEEQQNQYMKGEVDSLGNNINNDVSELNSNPSESTTPTLDDVRAALRNYASQNGADKAKEILAKFKANKVSELKEKDFDKVLGAVNA